MSNLIPNPTILISGTYTPTLTSVLNVTGATAGVCQYMRVGSVVTVSGRIQLQPTLAVDTQLGISFPIASNLNNTSQCAGVAFSGGVAGLGACILGDTSNDRAQLELISVAIGSSNSYAFTFQYSVI